MPAPRPARATLILARSAPARQAGRIMARLAQNLVDVKRFTGIDPGLAHLSTALPGLRFVCTMPGAKEMSTPIILFMCIVGGSALYCCQLVAAICWIAGHGTSVARSDSLEEVLWPGMATIPDPAAPLHQPVPAIRDVLDAIVAAETDLLDGAAETQPAPVPWRLPGGYSWPDRSVR